MSEAATAEHGLIGALQTTPMISTDGFVDGFCFPRFDSPNVFGALPDEKRGEHSRGRRSGRPASHAEPWPTPASHVAPDTARGRSVDHRGPPVQNCRTGCGPHVARGGRHDSRRTGSAPVNHSSPTGPAEVEPVADSCRTIFGW
jgi:hypothetical protein